MKLPTDHVCGVGIVKSSAYGGIGQKLLEKMGWSNGEGLGKERNGIRDAVKLKTQFHTHGLGHKPEPEWKTHNWTEIYEFSLRGIMTSEDPSNHEEEEVTPIKEKHTISKQRRNPDGTKTTADIQELRIYERLQSKKSGRWGLRRAKLERIKKQEQKLHNIKKQKNKKLKGIRKQQL